MRRIHGRKNESLEFVEFRNSRSRRDPSIVAQRAGEIWNVFKVWPGEKGAVRTLHVNIKSLAEAEAVAKREADALYTAKRKDVTAE